MEKIKRVVKGEVTMVLISEEEFVELASKACADLFKTFLDECEIEEAFFVAETCAKFSAYLTSKIFKTDNEENEEREEN